jgi:FkbM family methyltransferase
VKQILSRGRQLIELVLGFWDRVSVPEYQTWKFQRNQWIHRISPSLIVDVGANTGQWARDFRESFPNLGYLISFEPDSRAWAQYEKNLLLFQAELVRNAAGSSRRTAKLYEWSVAGGSSSLIPLTNHGESLTGQSQEGLGEAQVPVVRLDAYLSDAVDNLLVKDVYIKIDVQGGELEVLEGIERIVSSVCAIEIEIPLVMVYQGGSSTIEILRKLNAWGFTMISAQTERWNSSKLLAADFDALFVRNDYLTTNSNPTESDV